jgi:hypothetical protein
MKPTVFLFAGILFMLYPIWHTSTSLIDAWPQLCFGEMSFQSFDAKSGTMKQYGPYARSSFDCPKPGEQVPMLSDANGNPIIIDGKPLLLGTDRRLPHCPQNGNQFTCEDERPSQYALSAAQEWMVSGACACLGLLCAFQFWRARHKQSTFRAAK